MAKAKKNGAPKSRKTYADSDAGKREKSRDFASMRVTRAVRALRAVKRLANRKAYTYSDAQREQIVGVLDTEFRQVTDAFENDAAVVAESGFILAEDGE